MRRKRHRKNNRKYIILPAIFLLFLFSVGYSAFSSEFLISGKGTIVAKDFIHVGGINIKPVTTGSGLYESEYEEGRYIYRGASPDNYLTLGTDSYRIISKESDGTLKVIKSENVGDMPFDTEETRYSIDSLDYCNVKYGCNVWGSKTTMLDSALNNVTTMPRIIGSIEYKLPNTEASLNTYLNKTWYNSLSSNVQNVIITHLFYVGLVDSDEISLAATLIKEKTYKWSGKVGLLSVSDYVLATTNENCSNVNENSWHNDGTCYNTNSTDNWIYKDIMTNVNNPWLVAPDSNSSSGITWYVDSEVGALRNYATSGYHSTLPVFYLKSDIMFTGKGTELDPFILISN